jgi:bla regulator protein BlaR1
MESFSIQLWPFFEWLLRTTVQASLLIILILLVQLMLRGKLGVRWHYCLWLLLLIRLVMPWAPESRVSIFNLFQTFFERGPAELVSGNSAIVMDTSAAGQQTAGGIFITLLPLVWSAGALVLLCYMFVSNLVFWISVSRERPFADRNLFELLEKCKSQMDIRTSLRIVVTNRVKSPALFGFLRPVLLLPVGMRESLSLEEMRYVFLHELAHLKRHDVFVAHFVSIVQVLHWFNPLVWLAFYRMRADRELACDALVLSKMNVDEPKKYGRTIISLVELFHQNRHLPAMVGIMEDKLQLKRRIKMIAKFKKIPKKWSLPAVLVIALIAAMALTNATSSSKDDTDISKHTQMGWVGYLEGHEAGNLPKGYGGYGSNPGGGNGKSEPVYYPVSRKGSTPMGGMGYGGYGYGAYRVKRPEAPNSPEDTSPENRP